MIDRELSAALRAFHAARTQVPDPPALHERVLLLPLDDIPQQQSWLPRIPQWRFETMVSATKFVVAGVTVALFGGLLLTGGLTLQRSDESVIVVGATASASASVDATTELQPTAAAEVDEQTERTTRSDILPGVDLVTEEVEPGVFRVVSDGVRDVGYVTDRDYAPLGGEVVAGLDGSVWLFNPVAPDEDDQCWQCLDTFYRLGDPETHAAPRDRAVVVFGLVRERKDVAVAPDERLWAFVGPSGLMSFDGTDWQEHKAEEPPLAVVEVDAAGVIWTGTARGAEPGRQTTRIVGPDDSMTGHWKGRLVASPSGETLLRETNRGFWTWDGAGWTRITRRADIDPTPAVSLLKQDWARPMVADDGTIWMSTSTKSEYGKGEYDAIARFDGEAWTIFPRGDGADWGDLVGVAVDGSAWFAERFDNLDCANGLLRFDGETWQQHLDGYCPTSIDFSPNGLVWVQAVERAASGHSLNGPVHTYTYVITPEAVTATE